MLFRVAAVLPLLFGLVVAHAQQQPPVAPYQLRYGDRLQISVWREDALNREVRVLPDGSISFPLVGRIIVSGLSTAEIEKRLTEGLKPYIPEAIVTTVVSSTEGNSVFVLGKVLKSGVVPLFTPDTTVLQVLSQVGGLDRFANADAIVVLRKLPGDARPQAIRVRYNDLLRGEALDTNVVVRAGDTIVVPVKSRQRTAAAALGLLAASIGTPVFAQSPWTWSARVPTEFEYDSDVQTPTGTKAVQRVRVSPTVEGRYTTGREQFDIDGGVVLERSNDPEASRDRQDPRVRARWTHNEPQGFYRFTVAAERSAYRANDIEDLVSRTVDGTRSLYSIGADAVRDLGQRTTFDGEIKQSWVRYDVGTAADYRNLTGIARLRQGLDERRYVYGLFNFQSYRSDTIPATVLLLNPFARSASDVVGAAVGMKWTVSEGLDADVNAGVLSFIQASDIDWQAAGSLNYRGDRVRANLTLERKPVVSADSASLAPTNVARVQVGYDISQRSRLSFDAGISKSSGILATSAWTVGGSFTHELSQRWQLIVRAATRGTKQLANESRTTLVTFGIVYLVPQF